MRLSYSTEKDDTDTQLAISLAVRRVPARLIVISGGDRLDHTLAVIGAFLDEDVTSIPDVSRSGVTMSPIYRARSRHTHALNSTLSVMALSAPCNGITMTGTKWSLTMSH